MSEPSAERVRELVDRQDIWDCLMRYARGVDRLDEQLIRSAFWEDAFDDHGVVRGSPDDFIATWMPTQGEREACQHSISNHLARIEGDTAHAESYFQVAMRDRGAELLKLVGGRYLDRFERRAGSWRIADRLVLLDWQSEASVGDMDRAFARRRTGMRDRRDPSYERPPV